MIIGIKRAGDDADDHDDGYVVDDDDDDGDSYDDGDRGGTHSIGEVGGKKGRKWSPCNITRPPPKQDITQQKLQ